MEWQQLEYFRVVARLEHFGQAAKELAMGVQEIQHLKNPYTGTVALRFLQTLEITIGAFFVCSGESRLCGEDFHRIEAAVRGWLYRDQERFGDEGGHRRLLSGGWLYTTDQIRGRRYSYHSGSCFLRARGDDYSCISGHTLSPAAELFRNYVIETFA